MFSIANSTCESKISYIYSPRLFHVSILFGVTSDGPKTDMVGGFRKLTLHISLLCIMEA